MKNLYITLIALFLVSLSSRAQILGTPIVCTGSTTALSDPGASGWSSSDVSIATVDTFTGLVTGISAGTTTIGVWGPSMYTAYIVVTVNPTPTTTINPNPMCVGDTATLSVSIPMGVWSTTGSAVSATGMGDIIGVSAGTAVVSYMLPSTGCVAITIATVNPAPASISGILSLCEGSTTLLSDIVAGGTWSTPSVPVATVGMTTGIVTGVSPGTAAISYTVPSGCSVSVVVTVSAAPVAISGALNVCLFGGTSTLTDAATGGIWSTSVPSIAVVGSSSGLVTPITAGTAIITYTLATGCFSTAVVTVDPFPGTITGPSMVCEGSFITLTNATSGGTWTSSPTTVASVSSSSGVVTGVVSGTATISYYLPSGCSASKVVTVDALPTITVATAPVTLCAGITGTLSAAVTGMTGTTYLWFVNGVAASTGPSLTYTPSSGDIISCDATGTSTCSGGSYTVSSGSISPVATPTITAASTPNCGGTFSISGSGAGTGGTYIWSPAAGLSCTACAAPTASISSTTTYTVTGTNTSGCSGSGNVSVDADRISGYISLTTVPTDTLKVWLIQFNPADSSLIAEDSVFSCMDAGTPYYEFDGKPAGSYMVKAKLLSSVPGTSGYVPTYGLSSSTWDLATTIAHTAGNTDTQPITMIYGTVPAGPGFIGGLISSGAGRGTAGGAPVAGMLVYLKDATTGAIITYTYTDATGAYSFSSIANGAYIIYPVDYHYHTIPWVSVSPTTSLETVTGINFYQGTTSHSIKPVGTTVTPVCCVLPTNGFGMYPNPANDDVTIYWENEQTGNADVIISDITGREVYRSAFVITDHSGSNALNISGINSGVYFINLKAGKSNYTNKMLIQH